MARNDVILQRVADILADAGRRQVNRSRMLRELASTQEELCRRYSALKLDTVLTLVKGQKVYDVAGGIYRIRELVEPASWTKRLTVLTSTSTWAEVVRETASSGSAQPLYVTVWNRFLRMTPAPTVMGEELEVIGFGGPLAVPAAGGDPEIASEWDDALVLGTAARLLDIRSGQAKPGSEVGSSTWWTRYRDKAAELSHAELNETAGGVLRRAHSSDKLGF